MVSNNNIKLAKSEIKFQNNNNNNNKDLFSTNNQPSSPVVHNQKSTGFSNFYFQLLYLTIFFLGLKRKNPENSESEEDSFNVPKEN